MLKIRVAAATSLVAAVGLFAVVAAAPQHKRGGTSQHPHHLLTGTIRSATGAALEGVTVSAKREGTTITTSVYTDRDGVYILAAPTVGKYNVWAQAVGFGTGRTQLTVEGSEGAPAPVRHDFVLNTIADPSRQMSSSDWYATLPEDTSENRRMKDIFRTNCSGCHQPNYVLQNRFDEAGWRAIVDRMEMVNVLGGPRKTPWPIIRAHKDELVKYLARMRGPESTLKLTPLPRPRGDEALVVITEYDVDLAEAPGQFALDDGSDWSAGVPSSMNGYNGTHDIEIDFAGNIWVADSMPNKNRTYAKIDATTGKITTFKVQAGNGQVRTSHGMRKDQDGIIWFDLSGVGGGEDGVEGGTTGSLARLDPMTEKLDVYTPPKGMSGVGGALAVDGKGKIWASTRIGSIRFDPATKQFTEYKSPRFETPQGIGNTYGVAADADGNGYAAQMSIDVVAKADVATGKVVEIPMLKREKKMEPLTDADRKLYASVESDWNSTYPWSQGPRRLSGDPRSNSVWVGNWWGENLSKIDGRTLKVTEYSIPNKDFGGAYATVVDNHHIVWMNMMNADSVLRFDPKTERFTEYRLPTHGAETRHIAVLDRGDSPVVVVPYWRSSKVAKLEFRTPQQLAALKRQVQNGQGR